MNERVIVTMHKPGDFSDCSGFQVGCFTSKSKAVKEIVKFVRKNKFKLSSDKKYALCMPKDVAFGLLHHNCYDWENFNVMLHISSADDHLDTDGMLGFVESLNN